MKIGLTLKSLMLICSLLFGISFAAHRNSDQHSAAFDNSITQAGNAENVTVAGLPVIVLSEEEKTEFLQNIEWKNLSTDTQMSGLIHGFCGDETGDRCVVALNHIFVFEKQDCKACYSLHSEGSYTVFSDNGAFCILFDRENRILQFDENQASVLYKIIETELRSGEYVIKHKLHLIGTKKSIQSGNYILTNRHPSIAPIVSAKYDTLIWNDQAIYETSIRQGLIITVVVMNAIAAVILVIVFLRIRLRNKHRGNGSSVLTAHKPL